MPRKTKEQKELENEKLTTNQIKKSNKTDSKSSSKKDDIKKPAKTAKKAATATKSSTTKTSQAAKKDNIKSTTKKTTSTSKSTSSKSSRSTKTTTKSTKTNTTKTTRKSTSKKETTKSTVSVVEYYDLPYRYNQTIVKVLAQTPTNLFVYWDIADSDKENFKKQYGYDFFEKTRPILVVHNKTMNYAFEVEINDFANSWYLHVNDANCDYKIELGRKPVYNYIKREIGEEEQKDKNSEFNKYPSKPIDKNYFYITISNDIDSPNNHILAEDYNKPISQILLRNVKSNSEYTKNIDNLPISQHLNKLYNIKEIYKKLFEENTIQSFYDLSNPSSKGNPSSESFSSKFK